MKWVILFALILNLLPSAPVHAQATLFYYDQTTLKEAQQRYQKSMQEMLDIAIKPYLSAAEKEKVAKVKLEIPLVYNPSESQADETNIPFGAYAYVNSNKIIIPALTLKFLDDLSLAYAWLYINDCSLETPFEYISMLKYRSVEGFPNHRYPLPLNALQIPKDATRDPKVDELGLNLFNHARAFILAHELGHIYYQHSGNPPYTSPKESQRHETEADHFAVDVLSRSGTIPVGVLNLFMAMAHYLWNRWDFASNQEWEEFVMESSHPLSPKRIYTLATTIEENLDTIVHFQPNDTFSSNARDTVHFIADRMVQIGQHLDDKEVQLAIRLSASSTRSQDLAPRCKAPPTPTSSAPSLAFDGIYVGEYIRKVGDETETMPIRFILKRMGKKVLGYFNFGLGNGFLTGEIDGDSLYFYWEWSTASGHGNFYISEDGNSFEGEWGYGLAANNGGQWIGRRE